MTDQGLYEKLEKFATEKRFRTKGPLCVAIIVTQHAKRLGLPLNPDDLLTKSGGQVRGLGKSPVQAVLTRHGIMRVLAQEGGRTSRGSINRMKDYVVFLNGIGTSANLEDVEKFWISRVRQFFAAQPLRIRLDSARGLRSTVRDILEQAAERDRQSDGTSYSGAVLQHLVGAKLSCAFGDEIVEHNSYSTADAPGGRAADFPVGGLAIHVTIAPSEALINRCIDNLDGGHRPVLITTEAGVPVAVGLATNQQVESRIDVFEAEQFIALNLYERGAFQAELRTTTINSFILRYNRIIDLVETDPSLRIEIQ